MTLCTSIGAAAAIVGLILVAGYIRAERRHWR